MNKQIFKIGDRVFDIRYGWGEVTKYINRSLYPIGVQFKNVPFKEIILYTEDGKIDSNDNKPLLSFKEYGFDNRFSQKKPINYKNYIGQWGIFRESRFECTFIDTLRDVYGIDNEDGDYYEKGARFIPYEINKRYKYFEPLTEEQLKILKLK